MELHNTAREGIKEGNRINGRVYSVRDDRSRFFFPDEWDSFHKCLLKKNQLTFEFLLYTGARIEESRHIRPVDFDFDRSLVRIWKTKVKAKKKERVGKTRTIRLPSAFSAKVRRQCRSIGPNDPLFPSTASSTWKVLRKRLKLAGVADWYAFSLHNIRKTHGMWLKAMGVDAGEICLRLGHSYETYLAHYGSADVFSDTDARKIEQKFGDLYDRRRR